MILSALMLYFAIGYAIAWRATPMSRPFGRTTLFLTATYPLAFIAQAQFTRTGKWSRWYPAI